MENDVLRQELWQSVNEVRSMVSQSCAAGDIEKELQKVKGILEEDGSMLRDIVGAVSKDVEEFTNTVRLYHDDIDDFNPWIQDKNGIYIKFAELPCVEESFRKFRMGAHQALLVSYEQQLNALRQRFEDILKNKNGGWTEDDHFTFVKILEEYSNAGGETFTATRGSMVTQRVSKELGHPPLKTIGHERWYREYLRYHRLKKTLYDTFHRRLTEFITETQKLFEEVSDQCKDFEEKALDHQMQLIKTEGLQNKVKKWRTERIGILQREEFLQQAKFEFELEKQMKNAEDEKRVRMQQRHQISHFKDTQRLEVERAMKHQREDEKMREREVLEIKLHNSQRIQYRHNQMMEKDHQRREIAEEREMAHQELLLKLKKLAATVKPVVESDPERLHRDTESFAKYKAFKEEGTKMYKTFGYSDSQVMKDPKFRFLVLLREMGIQTERGSEYVQSMMGRIDPMAGAKEYRKDARSNISF